MAIINTKDLPTGLRSTDRLVKQRAVGRCLKEEFVQVKSNENKWQIYREWEVISPEMVELNGAQKVLAGTKLKQYMGYVLKKADGSRDDAQSNVMLARVRDERKAMQLPYEELDGDTASLDYVGLLAELMLDSDEYTFKNPPTPEDAAQGIKTGSDKIDPETGKPIVGYRPKLSYVINRVQATG